MKKRAVQVGGKYQLTLFYCTLAPPLSLDPACYMSFPRKQGLSSLSLISPPFDDHVSAMVHRVVIYSMFDIESLALALCHDEWVCKDYRLFSCDFFRLIRFTLNHRMILLFFVSLMHLNHIPSIHNIARSINSMKSNVLYLIKLGNLSNQHNNSDICFVRWNIFKNRNLLIKKINSTTLKRKAFQYRYRECVCVCALKILCRSIDLWWKDMRQRLPNNWAENCCHLIEFKDSPNECARIVHVLCEENNAKERNDHECRNTFLYIPLDSFHHMATYSGDKAIFTVYAIIVDYEAICTGWRRCWRSHIIKLVICECDTVWCRPQHGNTLLMLLRGHDLPP